MTNPEKVKIVAKILRKKFSSVSALEATHVAYTIVEALEKIIDKDKVEAGNES